MEKNYTIELDVQLTKDKKLVVFHDDNLKRMTNCDKKLKDISVEFNISQSRISRIIQNALDKVKKEILKQEVLENEGI